MGIFKYIFLLCFMMFGVSFGATSQSHIWQKGATFLNFLESHKIPLKVYYDLYGEDKELTAEIYAGTRYYTLIDDSNNLFQALIPLNDETQIHVFKNNDDYKIDFIPVKYFSSTNSIAISIQRSPYQDIIELTDNMNLANEFINIYKNAINFNRSVVKNDKLALIYNHKYRLGRNFGHPDIKASLIETSGKPNFLFAFSDGKYYNEKGNQVDGFLLSVPTNGRISSRFSYSRLHPILKVRRPHYGVDYATPIGTRVKAAAEGRVIFAGTKNGYGKVVEIQHGNGLKTLYAHLSSFSVKRGQYVKKNQSIAKVGNSGMSTGAHLHFGLYKNNRPINPLSNIKTTTIVLNKEQKKEFMQLAQDYKKELQLAITEQFSINPPSYFALND